MKKIVIWGIGGTADIFLNCIEYEVKADIVSVVGFTGSDEIASGTIITKKEIEAPFYEIDSVRDLKYDDLVICSLAVNEIKDIVAEKHIIDKINMYVWNDYLFAKIVRNRFINFCNVNQEYKQKHNDIYSFVQKYEVSMYPYEWAKLFAKIKYKVYQEGKLKYVYYNGKKLYFPGKFDDSSINFSLNRSVMEQELFSPHCYMPSAEWSVKAGDVVVDGGAAEASFSLDIVDRVSKLYIFEGDPLWKDALDKTFEPYSDKVKVIDKYLDSYVHVGYETIDSVVKEKTIDFIKLDVEGFELKTLYGAKEIISRSPALKMSICAYHNHEDYDVITSWLDHVGCRVVGNNGYLFRTDNSIFESEVPDLRVGMIYAENKIS